MRPISNVILALATLLGVGAAFCIDASEKPQRHWPKPTPPPPPSPIYTQSPEHAWSEEEIARQSRDHNAQLEAAIEGALVSKDSRRREAAFTFLLPELVQVDPPRLVTMVARQRPGEARRTLIEEVTRAWIARDPGEAVRWMKTLPDDDCRASAMAAVDSIFAQSPVEAAALADEFGLASLVLDKLKASRN
jgi:hypothetical protein